MRCLDGITDLMDMSPLSDGQGGLACCNFGGRKERLSN